MIPLLTHHARRLNVCRYCGQPIRIPGCQVIDDGNWEFAHQECLDEFRGQQWERATELEDQIRGVVVTDREVCL